MNNARAGGTNACKKVISDLNRFMDANGYKDIDSLCGDALKLFNMDKDLTAMRQNRLADACQNAQVSAKCIGCGYCFQVCPTGALHVEKEKILASAFEDREITRGM